MFFALVLCGVFAFSSANLQQVTLPVYVPPSQDAILKKYFQPEVKESHETVQKDRKTVEEDFYKAIVFMKNDLTKNITKLRRESYDKSVSEGNATSNASSAVNDVVWTGLLRNLLRNSYETTTYRYPTATWTAEHHERLKQLHKNQLQKMPKIFLMKPSLLLKPVLGPGEGVRQRETHPAGVTAKPKRGKVKWEDSRQQSNSDAAYKGLGKEEVDKFLEQSLLKYLVSSNLIENIGNVSVETFSEILRNITRQKAEKRQFWPYDENKELRIKFRDEVFMKRKAESPSRRKFLEKQFQRRLERMKDYLSGKTKDKLWRSKSGEESANRTTEASTLPGTEAVPTEAPPTLPSLPADNETQATTIQPEVRGTELPVHNEAPQTERKVDVEPERRRAGKPEFEELKLSVAETVYYKKRPFPLRSFSFEEEETGVIPGVPEIDYPMYSSPPSTGFKCPKEIGEQPRMMADTQTRCQVFYVCTGDGPAAAMLCPNGTMFNENVRVCDWWYNVDC